MFKKRDRNEVRVIRHARVRKKISGTPEMPRLCVYRSNKSIYAQIIDDTKGVTLVSASTLDPQIKGQLDDVDKKGTAKLVGKLIGERALNAGLKNVVFDRGGYIYTGRVAELAAGMFLSSSQAEPALIDRPGKKLQEILHEIGQVPVIFCPERVGDGPIISVALSCNQGRQADVRKEGVSGTEQYHRGEDAPYALVSLWKWPCCHHEGLCRSSLDQRMNLRVC